MQRFYSVAYQQFVNKFSPYVVLKFYLIYLKFVKIKCMYYTLIITSFRYEL